MSYTLRGKTVGYDNIAAGSATGVERTINGNAPPSDTAYGKLTNISQGGTPGTPEQSRKGDTDLVQGGDTDQTTTDPLATEALGSSNIAGMTS